MKTKPKTETTTQHRLAKIVEAFPRLTVAVLGDLVADEFVFGEISRVSREAPVLILKHRERNIVPGGGANAIYNLAALEVNVLPVGVVGDDEAGRALLHQFRQKHIPLGGILKLKGRVTVTKTRILAGMAHTSRQQVVRVDREPADTLDRHAVRELIMGARQYARAADALLISDYGYGAASPEILNAIRSRGALDSMPVTLDSRYRLLGFQIGSNNGLLMKAGQALLQRMQLDSLVITRGRDGMVAFAKKRAPVEIPIHGSGQVADVTGAGDTVIATFTAALAAGASAEDAARLANIAGGIVVMKRGTATCSRQELLKEVASS